MKKILLLPLLAAFLNGCITFGISPQPLPAFTPFPTRTPSIITATPLVFSPTAGAIPLTNTIIANTETPTVTPTTTITPTSPPVASVDVEILGCNTSIDILHSMGEVTNAYVTIRNTGGVDLPNTCSLLRAIDEDREHPDKKACVPNLPIQNQVTFKLTVDSAYQQNTIIQVDTSSNDLLLLRVDKQSCRDIGLFGGVPEDTGVVKPIQ